MKNNQKGFTAVEGLLLALIVGAVGFVGWYVYKAQNTAKQPDASITLPNEKKVEEEDEDQPLAFNPDGDIVAKGETKTLKALSFAPPAGWEFLPATEEGDHVFVEYRSPDFKGVQFANGSSTKEGGEFSVSADKTDYKTIQKMYEDDAITYFGPTGTKVTYTTVDGVDAVIGQCGHFGTADCRGLIYKGYYYQISYRQVDEKVKDSKTPDNKYAKEFTALLNSVSFQ